MPVAVLLHLLVMAVGIGVPGLLLYRIWLERMGLSWRVSVAVAFAGITVLLIWGTALIGYSLPLALGINGALLLALVVLALRLQSRQQQQSLFRIPQLSPQSILFHLVLVAVYLAPAFVLYLPLDTDAQGFGYLALMLREGGTIHTLAPWHPEVNYLYSPGLFIWWAYFSDLLNLPLHQVMLPFSHITTALLILLFIDLGEVADTGSGRLRWLTPLMAVLGLSLLLTIMDSHYTSIFALTFAALFLILGFRALTYGGFPLIGLAALALGAVALTHPDTIIILLAGYLPFYATFWLSKSQLRTWPVWRRFFLLIPVLGIALTLPWVARVLPLFFEDHIASPFIRLPQHWIQLVLFQGGLVTLLAAAGIVRAIMRRRVIDLFMVTWVVLIWDLALVGVTETLVNLTPLDVMRYVYPVSVAWHGPIIPYAVLAALALDAALNRWPVKVPGRVTMGGMGLALVLALAGVLFSQPILQASFGMIEPFGAFSSRADLALFEQIREDLPEDALILNYPVGLEGHWAPTLTERETVVFRPQYFFNNAAIPLYERMGTLTDVYFDLSTDDARDLLAEYDVTHVLYPQLALNPTPYGDMSQMMRWRWPHEWRNLDTHPDDVEWLELQIDVDGARLYRVLPGDD